MAWYGLISAAIGVLAIVTTLASADHVGLMARPALARILVLGSSWLIWAGVCLAILGLVSPAAAAEAGTAATWWPGELAGGLAVLALAIGVVMIGFGLIDRFGLSGPLPFGVALVTVAVVLWIVSAAWASPAAAQGQVQLTSTIVRAGRRDHGGAGAGAGLAADRRRRRGRGPCGAGAGIARRHALVDRDDAGEHRRGMRGACRLRVGPGRFAGRGALR